MRWLTRRESSHIGKPSQGHIYRNGTLLSGLSVLHPHSRVDFSTVFSLLHKASLYQHWNLLGKTTDKSSSVGSTPLMAIV